MKKYFFLLLTTTIGLTSSSQSIEYIDISTKGIFGRSEMVLYNDDINYNDLEYLYIGKNNDNWHWVKYTNANEIIVTLNDNSGDYREICIKQGNDSLFCQKYDAFAKEYHFKSNQTIFEIWISKANDI